MAKKRRFRENKAKLNSDSRLFAFLAVFLSVIGFIIALLAKRDDKYVMFYAKQSLVLFIACLIAVIVGMIPVIGWFAYPVLFLIVFILWIITWVNALSGREKETPLIGQYTRKINL